MPRRGPQPQRNLKRQVGERIRAIREAQGISQAELARRSDSSPAHVQKLEAGLRSPNISTLQSLAAALGVEVKDFFDSDEASGDAPLADRRFLRIVRALRAKDSEYLEAVEGVMRILDRNAPRARRGR